MSNEQIKTKMTRAELQNEIDLMNDNASLRARLDSAQPAITSLPIVDTQPTVVAVKTNRRDLTGPIAFATGAVLMLAGLAGGYEIGRGQTPPDGTGIHLEP